MNRGNFIKISGVSIAGLIINTSSAFANLPPQYLLALPDEISINSGGQLMALFSTDKLKWTNRDVEVTIQQEGTVLKVYV